MLALGEVPVNPVGAVGGVLSPRLRVTESNTVLVSARMPATTRLVRGDGDLDEFGVGGFTERAVRRLAELECVESVAAGAGHHVGDSAAGDRVPVDEREGAFVVVAVAGQHQVDLLGLEQRDQVLPDDRGAGVGGRRAVRRAAGCATMRHALP